MKTEEDEEFERIAAKCKETGRVNESKWNLEMCSNYGGFCKKEWVGLSNGEMIDLFEMKLGNWDLILEVEAKLKERNT